MILEMREKMYKVLNDIERLEFANKYFQKWVQDIWKVSTTSYQNVIEYLINDHYLFLVKD